MVRQGLIKLLGSFIQRMKSCPGDGGEVVVLVVVSDIVGKNVERTIVRKGLRERDLVVGVALSGGNGLVYIVLGDEVASQGVQAASQEGREQKVEKSVVRSGADQDDIERDLNKDVESVNLSQVHAVHRHGTDGVEEDLKGAKECLAEDRVEHKGLESGGQISVKAIHAEGLVVGKVVWL